MSLPNIGRVITLRGNAVELNQLAGKRFGEVGCPANVNTASAILDKEVGPKFVKVGDYGAEVDRITLFCFVLTQAMDAADADDHRQTLGGC